MFHQFFVQAAKLYPFQGIKRLELETVPYIEGSTDKEDPDHKWDNDIVWMLN